MRRFAFLFVPYALACGSSGAPDDGGATDGTVRDAPGDAFKADTGVNDSGDSGAADAGDSGEVEAGDAGTAADSGPDAQAKCSSANDCRMYSSYCNGSVLKPCVCYGLQKQEPDPVCDGNLVTCLIDPCLKKKAGCDAGACGVY